MCEGCQYNQNGECDPPMGECPMEQGNSLEKDDEIKA